MLTRKQLNDFYLEKKIAILGVSTSGQGFGKAVVDDLAMKGYTFYIIHPTAKEIGGKPCYSSFSQLPEKVERAIFVIPPAESERMIPEAAAAGIKMLWLQQGSESRKAVELCKENGLDVIAGECIMMYAEPVATFHKPHRWFNKLFGRGPKD